jgi:aspartate racemase
MSELVAGLTLPDTHEGLSAIITRLKDQAGIEAVILGGTELPLILRDPKGYGVPLRDTTRLHVEELVARLVA